MENSKLGVTKEQYFEICAALGSEPNEDEIPVEFDDLLLDVQLAFLVYNKLKDEYDTMNGIYLGKSLVNLQDILSLLEVPRQDWTTMFDLVTIIDNVRSEILNRKTKSK